MKRKYWIWGLWIKSYSKFEFEFKSVENLCHGNSSNRWTHNNEKSNPPNSLRKNIETLPIPKLPCEQVAIFLGHS